MAQRKIPLFFLQFTLHVWSFLDMHEMTQVIDFLCAHFRQCCKQRAVSRLGLGKINPHLVHTTFSFFLVQSLVLLANSIANAFVFYELFFAIQFSSKQFFWRIIFWKLRKIIFNLKSKFSISILQLFSFEDDFDKNFEYANQFCFLSIFKIWILIFCFF